MVHVGLDCVDLHSYFPSQAIALTHPASPAPRSEWRGAGGGTPEWLRAERCRVSAVGQAGHSSGKCTRHTPLGGLGRRLLSRPRLTNDAWGCAPVPLNQESLTGDRSKSRDGRRSGSGPRQPGLRWGIIHAVSNTSESYSFPSWL